MERWKWKLQWRCYRTMVSTTYPPPPNYPNTLSRLLMKEILFQGFLKCFSKVAHWTEATGEKPMKEILFKGSHWREAGQEPKERHLGPAAFSDTPVLLTIQMCYHSSLASLR